MAPMLEPMFKQVK